LEVEHLHHLTEQDIGRMLTAIERERRGIIEALSHEARSELLALMLLGRGDFAARGDTFADCVAWAQREFPKTQKAYIAAGYITSKSGRLYEYLHDGLALLAYMGSGDRIEQNYRHELVLRTEAGQLRVFSKNNDAWEEVEDVTPWLKRAQSTEKQDA
jgi:Protein of unknown function (DUF3775)